MTELAFVTPTFTPDLHRCELLVESLDLFAPNIIHYLIIDEREIPAFRHLESGRTKLLISEELIGLSQLRVRIAQSYWLHWRTLPMRGWMRQQLLKIAVSRAVDANALVYLDSDVAFVRPFSPDLLQKNGRWCLLDVNYAADMVPRWTKIACDLLGLDVAEVPLRGHVGHMITWSRDHLLALQQRIERVVGLPWQIAIGRKPTVSEYILYGVFVRCVLGYPQSQQFPSARPLVRQPWSHDLSSIAGLRAYVCEPDSGNVAVMVHSKFNIPVDVLRPLFQAAWHQAPG